MGWKVGQITVTQQRGDEIIKKPVAGWVNGPLGIDFRVWEIAGQIALGWTVTHIPTGYVVTSILEEREQAMEFVERLLSAGNWDFPSPDDAVKLREAVKSVVVDCGMERTTKIADYGSTFFGGWTR